MRKGRRLQGQLFSIQVCEVGKAWDEADADVCEGIDYLEYYAREMLRLAVPQRVGKVQGEESVLFYEPRGVATVLALMKVRNFREGLDVANSSSYALTGAVFSRSPRNLALAREKFRVGNLYLNRGSTGAVVGRHPFGGFKMSGGGSKAGGPDYLLEFMVARSVAENTLRRGFAPSEP